MFLFQLLGCHGFRAEQRGLNDHGRHDSETWNKLFDESFCKPAGLVRNTYVARFLFVDDGWLYAYCMNMITRYVRIINYHFEYSLYRISEACHRGILTICTVDHPGPGYHFCPQILVAKGARWNTVSTNNLWQWGPWIGVDLHHVTHLCIACLPFRQQWKVISPPTRFPDKLPSNHVMW